MLAYRLGKTVKQLLREADAIELQEWKIWSRYHPIDDAREDARPAMICRTVANIARVKGQRAFTTQDFMPTYSRPKKQPSELLKFKALCMIQGIKITRAK